MKKYSKIIIASLASTFLFTGLVGVKAEKALATTLPTNIVATDMADDDIRTYYATVNNKSGDALLTGLKTILKDHTTYSYDQVWSCYKITERNWKLSPMTSSQLANVNYSNENPYVRLLYRNDNDNSQTAAHANDTHGTYIDREHIWPKSLGNFDTNAPAGTDLHHLRAGDHTNNSSSHNNYAYGNVPNGKVYGTDENHNRTCKSGDITYKNGTYRVFEPQDCDKGDIARACFYMAARYSSFTSAADPYLKLTDDYALHNAVDSSATAPGYLASLSTLLEWHKADPVDEFEIHRNNLIYYNYQHNRNPFIDFPEWADIAFGKGTTTTNVSTDPINKFSSELEEDSCLTAFKNSSTFASLNVDYEKKQGSEMNHYWSLVNKESDLSSGSTYTIASMSSGDGFVMAKDTKANNRSALPATATNKQIAENPAILQLTLGGSSGSYTFFSSNYQGGASYMNATNTTSNYYLKMVTSNDKYGKFDITFNNDKAVITCTGKDDNNVIKYNSGSSIFSCYKTSGTQSDVYLFKRVDTTPKYTYFPTKTNDQNNIALSFGTWLKASDKKGLDTLGATEYGIAYKKASASDYTYQTLEGAFTSEQFGSIEINETVDEATTNNHYFQFVLSFKNIPENEWDVAVTACAFCKIQDQYYLNIPKSFSVKTLAAKYLENTGDLTVNSNREMLTWLSTYGD